jgi:enamine deaminase RidA (YjgF/YER057c/UK114 family)
MFNEFEVVCPNCEAILRLSSDWYEELIKEKETDKPTESCYEFPCVECENELKMEIKVTVG